MSGGNDFRNKRDPCYGQAALFFGPHFRVKEREKEWKRTHPPILHNIILGVSLLRRKRAVSKSGRNGLIILQFALLTKNASAPACSSHALLGTIVNLLEEKIV
jgi:hypothetical protein